MTDLTPVHIYDACVEMKRRRTVAREGSYASTPTPPTLTTEDVVTITDPVAWSAAAVERVVAEVKGTTTGGRNAAAHKAGQTVGRLVGAGLPVDAKAACEAVLQACRDNGHVADDGEHAALASIRSGYQWGFEHPLAWAQAPTVPVAVGFDVPDGLAQANPAVGAGVVDGDALAAYYAAEVMKERARRHARTVLDSEESAASYVRVPLKRGDTFLAEPDPPITWAVEGLAQIGHNVLLTAQYKTGKTTFLLNLARAVADGVRFLDHFPTSLDLGKISMLDYELGEAQYRRWLREVGVVQVDKVLVGHWRGVRGRFDDERNVADLVEQLGGAGVGVAVIDPFAAAAKGVDENDNGAVGAFLNLIDYVKREAGVHTVILATHTGRRDADIGHERARGATRLDDWPDVRWLLTKGKDGDETRYFAADGRDVGVGAGALNYTDALRRYSYTGNTPGIVAARSLERDVLVYVRANPNCSAAAVEKFVTGKGDAIRKAVDNLTRRGNITDVGEGQAHSFVFVRDPGPPVATPLE